MLNNLLLIKGYRLCISKSNEQLIGVYIKGTEHRIDDLFELNISVIEKFERKYPNIIAEVTDSKYFVAQYDYQNMTFLTDIREKTYSGPYGEEITYNIIYNSSNSENLYLSLANLEKDILINKKSCFLNKKQKIKKRSTNVN